MAHIMASEGATVDVGTLVAVIAEPGESVARPSETRPQKSPTTSKRKPSATSPTTRIPGMGGQVTPVARKLARQNNIDIATVQGTGPNGRITEQDVRLVIEAPQRPAAQVVPRARLLAREHDIDLGAVQGSGPNGRILVADVERAVASQIHAPAGEVVPLKGLRKTIADRMMQSVQTMAQVTLTTEADVTEVVRLRQALVSEWRPHRLRPVDQDIIVKVVAASLCEHPRLNALLVNNEIRLLDEVNIGLAMAVPDGLLVPVIRRSNEKDLLSIARETRELADKSRKNELSIDDMTGAGFTITSLSTYEIDAFTPIIDPPQVAILGVGRIVEKPAVHQGEIAVRSMMFLSLAFDHRALDGVPAAEFLRTLKRKLEDPGRIASGQ